jgi:hypothetical protein
MRVYIGWDSREVAAFTVADKTARSFGCEVTPIYESQLRASGLLTRPVDRRGRMYDLNSNAEQSTEFAISRFFAPLLHHAGRCLAVDCDVVFLEDPRQLMEQDEDYAVWVVKHPPYATGGTKMDGQTQSVYPRMNLTTLNQWPGRDLHAFGWLADSEIGELPAEANWLVGIQPKPDRPIIAHFTQGTPDMPGYEHSEHAEIWTEASQR